MTLYIIIYMVAAIISVSVISFAAFVAWIHFVQERARQDCPWGRHWGDWS